MVYSISVPRPLLIYGVLRTQKDSTLLCSNFFMVKGTLFLLFDRLNMTDQDVFLPTKSNVLDGLGTMAWSYKSTRPLTIAPIGVDCERIRMTDGERLSQ